jgi:hypothetical protein
MRGALKGDRALAHSAYDFGLRRWEDIAASNVTASHQLLEAAPEVLAIIE